MQLNLWSFYANMKQEFCNMQQTWREIHKPRDHLRETSWKHTRVNIFKNVNNLLGPKLIIVLFADGKII